MLSGGGEMGKDVLYYYCSTFTFHSIIENRSIWLSSLSLSSDSLEGKIVERVMVELATEAGMNSSHIKRLRGMIENLLRVADGLGFCLSQAGDILSQWRGYAADGTGVSIGFSTEYLTWLAKNRLDRDDASFILRQVKYRTEEHRGLVEPAFQTSREYIEAGAFDTPGLTILASRSKGEIEEAKASAQKALAGLISTVLPLLTDLFVLKSDAFQEEREWRLISLFSKGGSEHCSHHAVEDRIIRHREVAIEELERGPVVKVILGPKHQSPVENVKEFLAQNGFADVEVERSKATYR